MALQSSGQISLDDLHVEVGGTSGTQCSMNDSDIRGLVSAAANSQMTFSSFYGASSAWTATMTVGTYSWFHGYWPTFNLGSMSDLTIDILSNASISDLFHSGNTSVNFTLNGNIPNSGWSTLTIGNTVFTRASASYSYLSPKTYYTWSNVPNPFGTSGTKTITMA